MEGQRERLSAREKMAVRSTLKFRIGCAETMGDKAQTTHHTTASRRGSVAKELPKEVQCVKASRGVLGRRHDRSSGQRGDGVVMIAGAGLA